MASPPCLCATRRPARAGVPLAMSKSCPTALAASTRTTGRTCREAGRDQRAVPISRRSIRRPYPAGPDPNTTHIPADLRTPLSGSGPRVAALASASRFPCRPSPSRRSGTRRSAGKYTFRVPPADLRQRERCPAIPGLIRHTAPGLASVVSRPGAEARLLRYERRRAADRGWRHSGDRADREHGAAATAAVQLDRA
jgi:hypothetical protein